MHGRLLDDWSYIFIIGPHHFSLFRDVKIDDAVGTALVERWRHETHTFHFSIGKAIVTLRMLLSFCFCGLMAKLSLSPNAWLASHPTRDWWFNAWCPFTWRGLIKTTVAPRALWSWTTIWCHRPCRATIHWGMYSSIEFECPRLHAHPSLVCTSVLVQFSWIYKHSSFGAILWKMF